MNLKKRKKYENFEGFLNIALGHPASRFLWFFNYFGKKTFPVNHYKVTTFILMKNAVIFFVSSKTQLKRRRITPDRCFSFKRRDDKFSDHSLTRPKWPTPVTPCRLVSLTKGLKFKSSPLFLFPYAERKLRVSFRMQKVNSTPVT